MNQNNKIFRTVDDYMSVIENWKKQNLKLVFTNGCFDILHPGHLKYLYDAGKLGDKLIIGLNSDESVKQQNKGKNRPINNFEFRSNMLSWYNFIDMIIEFEESTPEILIKKITPHILTKGGDYIKENIVGYHHVIKNGGEVIILPFSEGFSTTSIIEKIKKADG